MDIQTQKMLVLGLIGLGLAAISAWQHMKDTDNDGEGWGILAFCFLFTSCSQN
jgi:hypothetical protein